MEYPHYFSPGAASGISLLFPGGRARSGCPRSRERSPAPPSGAARPAAFPGCADTRAVHGRLRPSPSPPVFLRGRVNAAGRRSQTALAVSKGER